MRTEGGDPAIHASDLRLITVFVMGVSAGLCMALLYMTWRDRHPPVAASEPTPALQTTGEVPAGNDPLMQEP